MVDSLQMDFQKLDQLRVGLDNHPVEYIYNKFFDNPANTWQQARQHSATWQFPDCWMARYWCYFDQNGDLLKNARILDIGANFNFYGVWALEAGASHIHAVEPDSVRYALGKEYTEIVNRNNQYTYQCTTVDSFMRTYQGESYDVVFLLDMIYFLTNGIDLLDFIKKRINPRYVFLESNIDPIECNNEQGHFKLISAPTQSRDFSAVSDSGKDTKISLLPSALALRSVINDQGWKIHSYYDYKDFVGRGDSPPRREARTNFYVLENV